MYRRRAERMLASLIRLGMARIRARTAISFVMLVYVTASVSQARAPNFVADATKFLDSGDPGQRIIVAVPRRSK